MPIPSKVTALIVVSIVVLITLATQLHKINNLSEEIEMKNRELTISALHLEYEKSSTLQCQSTLARQNNAIAEQEVAYLSALQQIDELRRVNVHKRTEIVKEFIFDPSCTNQLLLMEKQLKELLSTIGGER